jgi:uncharacterized membrane protein (UPF0127 family)
MIFAYPAIAIILSALIVFFPPPVKKNIYIGGKKIKITEARSIASKATGLAGKPDKKGKNAMLFNFVFSSKKTFWALGMKFPIDIFWIRQGKIISVSKNITPGTKIIVSPEKVNMVIEISSALRKKEDIPVYGNIVL